VKNQKNLFSKIFSITVNLALMLGALALSLYVTDISFKAYLSHEKSVYDKKCKDFDFNNFANSRGFSLENAFYKPLDVVQHCGKEWNYTYHIDKNGFRTNGESAKSNPILAVGDSFTFGFGVEDNESFTSLLDVKNAGMWGNPFDIQFKSLQRNVELTHPKVILWGIYPSHIITMMSGEWSKNCPGDTKILNSKSNPTLLKLSNLIMKHVITPLIENSSIFKFIFDKKGILSIEENSGVIQIRKNCYQTKEIILYDKNIANNNYTSSTEINRTFKKDLDDVYSKMNEYFTESKKIAELNNAEIYFFYIPSKLQLRLKDASYKPNIKNVDIDANLPTDTITNMLINIGYKEEHIIDLSKYIIRSSDWRNLYYKDDAHWNKYGHQFVSEIFKYLLEKK